MHTELERGRRRIRSVIAGLLWGCTVRRSRRRNRHGGPRDVEATSPVERRTTRTVVGFCARRAESLANVRSEVELGIRFPRFWLHRAIEPGNIFARMDRSAVFVNFLNGSRRRATEVSNPHRAAAMAPPAEPLPRESTAPPVRSAAPPGRPPTTAPLPSRCRASIEPVARVRRSPPGPSATEWFKLSLPPFPRPAAAGVRWVGGLFPIFHRQF